MKLNGESLKNLALEHGEKVVMALVAALLVGGGYSLVAHGTYEKAPPALKEQSQQARQHVDTSKWDAEREKIVVVDPNEEINNARQASAQDFLFAHKFSEVAVPVAARRPAPEVLAPTEIAVHSGFAGIAYSPKKAGGRRNGAGGADMADPMMMPRGMGPGGRRSAAQVGVRVPPGSETRGRYFTIVKGKASFKEQLEVYRRMFRNTRGEDERKDRPVFVGVVVERAEVTSGAPGEFKELSRKKILDERDRWAAEAPEMIDIVHVHPALTSPLPPIQERNWGKEVTIAPFPYIPLEPAEEVGGDEEMADDEEKTDEEEMDEGDEEAADEEEEESADTPRPRRRPGQMPGMPTMPNMQTDMLGSKRDFESSEDSLIRVFDFDVQPGKQYVYRMKLELKNPNYGLRADQVQDPKLAADRTISGPWSAVSTPVSIPLTETLVVGETTTPPGSQTEPKVSVILVLLDKTLGKEVPTKLELERGAYVREHEVVVDGAQKTYKPDVIVVDLQGEKRLIAGYKNKKSEVKVREPGAALLCNSKGELIVGNEESDEFERLLGKHKENSDSKEEANPLDSPSTTMPTPGGTTTTPGSATPGGASPAGLMTNPFDNTPKKTPGKKKPAKRN